MSFLIDKISQFINTYYLDPIRGDEGYNPVNTFTWAVILGICIFGVFRLLEKLEGKNHTALYCFCPAFRACRLFPART